MHRDQAIVDNKTFLLQQVDVSTLVRSFVEFRGIKLVVEEDGGAVQIKCPLEEGVTLLGTDKVSISDEPFLTCEMEPGSTLTVRFGNEARTFEVVATHLGKQVLFQGRQ